jgi:hypothetical protein
VYVYGLFLQVSYSGGGLTGVDQQKKVLPNKIHALSFSGRGFNLDLADLAAVLQLPEEMRLPKKIFLGKRFFPFFLFIHCLELK